MIVADTSVWINFLNGISHTFEIMNSLLEQTQISAVDCVFAELLQGVNTEKEIKRIKAYYDNLPKINPREIWIQAGEYSGRKSLIQKGVGIIDTVILLSAIQTNSKLWTYDKKLKSVIPKEFLFDI